MEDVETNAPASAPPVADVRVEADTLCAVCNYNLRGLAVDGVCPECASLIVRTLRGNLLRFSDPRYVARLTSGAKWVTIGSVLLGLTVAILVVALVLSATGWFGNTPIETVAQLALIADLFLLGSVPSWVYGWWRVTAKEPGVLVQRGRWMALCVRLTLVPLVLVWAISVVALFPGAAERMAVTAVFIFLWPCMLVMSGLGGAVLVALARRGADRRFAHTARLVHVFATLSMAVVPFLGAVLYFIWFAGVAYVLGFSGACTWVCWKVWRVLRVEQAEAARLAPPIDPTLQGAAVGAGASRASTDDGAAASARLGG